MLRRLRGSRFFLCGPHLTEERQVAIEMTVLPLPEDVLAALSDETEEMTGASPSLRDRDENIKRKMVNAQKWWSSNKRSQPWKVWLTHTLGWTNTAFCKLSDASSYLGDVGPLPFAVSLLNVILRTLKLFIPQTTGGALNKLLAMLHNLALTSTFLVHVITFIPCIFGGFIAGFFPCFACVYTFFLMVTTSYPEAKQAVKDTVTLMIEDEAIHDTIKERKTSGHFDPREAEEEEHPAAYQDFFELFDKASECINASTFVQCIDEVVDDRAIQRMRPALLGSRSSTQTLLTQEEVQMSEIRKASQQKSA